jgi:hypothetical protein
VQQCICDGNRNGGQTGSNEAAPLKKGANDMVNKNNNNKRQEHLKQVQAIIKHPSMSRRNKLIHIKLCTERIYDQDIANQFNQMLEYSSLTLHHSTTLEQVVTALTYQAKMVA